MKAIMAIAGCLLVASLAVPVAAAQASVHDDRTRHRGT
jgi:hypothetical protein